MEEDPRIGAVLGGRYRLLEEIAEGGMGVVYRGERIGLGRQVAIKFLHAWFASEDKARKRFEIEARAMARLQHPSCAAVIDFGLEGDAPYVVMDYFEGETLRDVLDRGPLSPPRALAIGRQILAGLAHAHALGIVHRDIKPANVLLGEAAGIGDQIKILDFGLAKLREGAPGLTAGMAIGTPSYMAPEQTMGEPVDVRTDVYAMGVLLYEMLTGQKPFAADSPGEVMLMHREQPRPPLAAALPSQPFSAELEQTIARAMAIDSAERFQSVVELSETLAATPESSGRTAILPAVPAPRPDTAAPAAPDPVAPTAAAATLGSGSVPAPAAAPGPGPAGSAPPAPAAAPGPGLAGSAPPAPAGAPGPGPHAAPQAGFPAPFRRRRPHKAWIAVGAGGLALALIIIIAASVGDDTEPPRFEGAAEVEDGAEPEADQPAGLAEVLELADAGHTDAALDRLRSLRRAHPQEASFPYWMGRLYFEKLWWSDGLDAYRAAMELAPAYRDDEELIKSVLRGFLVSRDWKSPLAGFLRDDIGAPAIPLLREAAAEHPDPRRRERVRRLLSEMEDGSGG